MSDKKFDTNARPQKIFRLFVALAAVLSAAPVKAQDAPTLQWGLVNPFRFIHDRASVDELRRVYDGLDANKKTAYDLERELQGLSEEEIKKRRAEAGKGSTVTTRRRRKRRGRATNLTLTGSRDWPKTITERPAGTRRLVWSRSLGPR